MSVRFTQVNTTQDNEVVLLKIKNISDLKTYNKVIKYLKELSVVTKVQAQQVNTDDVIFSINSRSGRLGIAQSISLGRVLVNDMSEPVIRDDSSENNSGQLKADLIYKMVP